MPALLRGARACAPCPPPLHALWHALPARTHEHKHHRWRAAAGSGAVGVRHGSLGAGEHGRAGKRPCQITSEGPRRGNAFGRPLRAFSRVARRAQKPRRRRSSRGALFVLATDAADRWVDIAHRLARRAQKPRRRRSSRGRCSSWRPTRPIDGSMSRIAAFSARDAARTTVSNHIRRAAAGQRFRPAAPCVGRRSGARAWRARAVPRRRR